MIQSGSIILIQIQIQINWDLRMTGRADDMFATCGLSMCGQCAPWFFAHEMPTKRARAMRYRCDINAIPMRYQCDINAKMRVKAAIMKTFIINGIEAVLGLWA